MYYRNKEIKNYCRLKLLKFKTKLYIFILKYIKKMLKTLNYLFYKFN